MTQFGPVRLPADIFAAIPRSRDVVSFHFGMDPRGHYLLLKFALANKAKELIYVPSSVAIALRKSLDGLFNAAKYQDVRRRAGDPLPDNEIIKSFLRNQPDIVDGDWDFKGSDISRAQAVAVEVQGFHDAVFVAFIIRENEYKVLRLDPSISFYLIEMIREAEAGGLIDLVAAQPPSNRRT